MLVNDVKETLIKYVNDGENIGLALSMGVDSVVLYNILIEDLKDYLKEHNISVYPLYFDHGLRKESLLETDYVRNGILNAQIGKWNFPKDSENEARKARYNFFNRTMDEFNIKKLFMAHHIDDLVERFFMKTIRGTSINGLSSFTVASKDNLLNNKTILRPFLASNTTKDDIYKYANEHDLEWFEDHTNQGNKYLRTRLRNAYLPLLKQEDKQLDKHVATLSRDISDLNELLKAEVKRNYWSSRTILGQPKLSASFKDTTDLVIKEVIKKFLNEYEHNLKLLTNSKLEELLDFIKNAPVNTRICVSKGVYLFKEHYNSNSAGYSDNFIVLMHDEDFKPTLTDRDLVYLNKIHPNFYQFSSKSCIVQEGTPNKTLKDFYNENKVFYHIRMKNLYNVFSYEDEYIPVKQ